MTTDPITQAKHEADLQERERGQREIEDGLRRSNKALADEVHRLRKMTDAAESALKREAELRAERDAAQARCAELERELEALRDDHGCTVQTLRETKDALDKSHGAANYLRSQLATVTARCAELERELEAAVRRADLGTAQILAIASVLDGDDKGETRDNPRWTPTLEHARRLRSKLYAVTADRDWFREALGDCVKAMDLWGSQEDGVPEAGEDLMGSIGRAYDNAKAMLCWADDPTLRKASSAPEPKSLTADECEQALRRGDTVRVSSMPSPYRVRGGVLECLKGGLWARSLLDVRNIVNDVRNGAECFLVPDPSQEQEV